MKPVTYETENTPLTNTRIKLAKLIHGPKRKTLVYNVQKALVIFPQKEKVSIGVILYRTCVGTFTFAISVPISSFGCNRRLVFRYFFENQHQFNKFSNSTNLEINLKWRHPLCTCFFFS